MINDNGYVWYGKFGIPVSKKCQMILKLENPGILLTDGGRADRYWAYINKITGENPDFLNFFHVIMIK